MHKSTRHEIDSLQAHVDLAMAHGQLVLILAPHLSDKAHGTETILEKYGTERLLVNSSADWGHSDPFTLQECIPEYRRRGHSL